MRPAAVGIAADYQHYWLKKLRSNAIYSYSDVSNTDFAAPATYNHATYTGANLIWNPYGSLNPRKKVGSILEEPLVINTQLDSEQRDFLETARTSAA